MNMAKEKIKELEEEIKNYKKRVKMTFLKTAKKSPLIHRNIMIYSQFRPFPALTTKKNPKKTSFSALKHDKKKHGMAQNGIILREKRHYSVKLKKVLKKKSFFNVLKFCVVFTV